MSTRSSAYVSLTLPTDEVPNDLPSSMNISQMGVKKGPKKRIGKREAMKKLIEENNELKALIGKMQQQIAAVEAQNQTMEKEITFFHKQIIDTMPMHPELKEKGLELLGKTNSNQNV
jgi:hypothetical protein